MHWPSVALSSTEAQTVQLTRQVARGSRAQQRRDKGRDSSGTSDHELSKFLRAQRRNESSNCTGKSGWQQRKVRASDLDGGVDGCR